MHAEQRRSAPFVEDDLLGGSEEPSTLRSRPTLSISGESASTDASIRMVVRKRTDSIRTRQERKLFTRRRSDIGSAATEETAPLGSRAYVGSIGQRQSLEETENLLPSAVQNGADATDLDVLIAAYKDSEVAAGVREEIENAAHSVPNGGADGSANGSAHRVPGTMKGFRRQGWFGQFAILSRRTWKNLYRNPLLMLAHYAISILLGGL